MNNWDQFQSTPKLLPPTVFEKTNLNNESNFNNNNSNSSIKNNENENLSRNSESQFNEFTSELEKLKFEIKKLHSENDVLRHKNRGN